MMTISSRIVALVGCVLLASAAVGCGSEPSEAPGFSPYPDSPLSAGTHDQQIAVGATAFVGVGPWKHDPSIIEQHGKIFELVSAESSHPDVIPNTFELPTDASHEHHLSVRAAEEGSSWLRVEGRLDPTTRAFQSVALFTEQPADAAVYFGCPEDAERPVVVSDGEPVRFLVAPQDADGEYLAGYLDRDIRLVGPSGENLQTEPVWEADFRYAFSSFVPQAPGEYVVELERFGRTVTFEVIGSEAVEEGSVSVCGY